MLYDLVATWLVQSPLYDHTFVSYFIVLASKLWWRPLDMIQQQLWAFWFAWNMVCSTGLELRQCRRPQCGEERGEIMQNAGKSRQGKKGLKSTRFCRRPLWI